MLDIALENKSQDLKNLFISSHSGTTFKLISSKRILLTFMRRLFDPRDSTIDKFFENLSKAKNSKDGQELYNLDRKSREEQLKLSRVVDTLHVVLDHLLTKLQYLLHAPIQQGLQTEQELPFDQESLFSHLSHYFCLPANFWVKAEAVPQGMDLESFNPFYEDDGLEFTQYERELLNYIEKGLERNSLIQHCLKGHLSLAKAKSANFRKTFKILYQREVGSKIESGEEDEESPEEPDYFQGADK